MTPAYEPAWKSLRAHTTPQWLRDAKFGIYTHWGIYSVPACGPNGSWYPYNMYRPGTEQYEFHVKNYGPPSEFGYKDFIPMFTAEKFDPDEWAELFEKAGARFAGPVAEHHDGFPMWDTAFTEWNAARMGPRRDVVGQLERAIRQRNMKFMVALHHAENWWFFPHWEKRYDTSDPAYVGLYGPLHNQEWAQGKPAAETRDREWELQDKPGKGFLDRWLGKSCEVIDRYRPDLIWVDFGLRFVQEEYKKELLTYYYNKEAEWGREVALTYKHHDLPPGVALADLELGRMGELTYHDWITDTSVDDQGAWTYVRTAGYKSATTVVHNLVDNVSKNGYLLLNVGPKPNGEIPEPAKECLLGVGKWLEVNGEAIYDTTPWVIYGEGPTIMKRIGHFSERDEVTYTAQDARFTARDNVLYAICLGWPGEEATFESLRALYGSEIRSVEMLGADATLEWSLTQDKLSVRAPAEKPCDHAYVFKITRTHPF